jgi:hypothetical protein
MHRQQHTQSYKIHGIDEAIVPNSTRRCNHVHGHFASVYNQRS